MTRYQSALAIFFLLFACSADRGSAADDAKPIESQPAKKVAPPAKPLITISKETTVITEPLRPDGYVDYIAAINERAKKGVTPENNAAVLFWQAMGPDSINADMRDEYFKQLSMTPPPAEGKYFIPLNKFAALQVGAKQDAAKADAEEKLNKQYDRMSTRTWAKADAPMLADWLATNEQPLRLIAEASRRPRRYDPLLGGKSEMLIATLLPAIQQYRELAMALRIRANFRLHDGKIDDAWDDLMTIRRLARLCGQGQTLIDDLVAIALDGIADAGDQSLFQYANLTSAQALKLQADVAKLPRLTNVAESIDALERYSYCDTVSNVARKGISEMAGLLDMRTSPLGGLWFKTGFENAAKSATDWDRILRLGNAWYDRMSVIARKPRGERRKAFAGFDNDLRKLAAEAHDFGGTLQKAVNDPRGAVSDHLGKIFVSLLLPAISHCFDAEDRGEMLLQIDRLGFALAAYHADHGAYPAKLAELTPKYVTQIPKDNINDEDLHYRLAGDGYLLYSVGHNGKDDGGPRADDAELEPGKELGDDIGLRILDSKAKPK